MEFVEVFSPPGLVLMGGRLAAGREGPISPKQSEQAFFPAARGAMKTAGSQILSQARSAFLRTARAPRGQTLVSEIYLIVPIRFEQYG